MMRWREHHRRPHEMDTPYARAQGGKMPTAVLSACPLFAESNERGPKGDVANRGGIPTAGTKYVPPPPRNSLSPINHLYPAQTADNTAPMNMTDIGYNNNREHEMPPAPAMYMNTQAPALVRVVGGSAGSVRLQPLWLLSPSPSLAMGIIFLYLISIYIYLCTCVDR